MVGKLGANICYDKTVDDQHEGDRAGGVCL
jgi:hypothetical protein